MMFVASYALKHELQNLISSPPVAFVASLVAVTMTLAVGSVVIWLGSRMIVGSFRHIPNGKGKA